MKFEDILVVIVLIILFAPFIVWLDKRSDASEEASQSYEQCVISEYGRTPGSIYLETGSYPTCKIQTGE